MPIATWRAWWPITFEVSSLSWGSWVLVRIMPFAALGGGILLTIAVVRAWRHRPATPAVAMPAGVSSATRDDLRQRVHQETEL